MTARNPIPDLGDVQKEHDKLVQLACGVIDAVYSDISVGTDETAESLNHIIRYTNDLFEENRKQKELEKG